MTPRLSSIVFATLLVLATAAQAAAQFDTPNRSFHNATAFRLEGQHLTVACEACHLNGQYQGTPTTCYDCHWIRRKDDRFETRLGTHCEECHRPTSWTAVQWDHGGQAGVPLSPVHRTLSCESCHRTASFTAPVACVSCHQRDYAATTEPNHAAAGFPVTCDSCHRPSDSTWQTNGGGGFNHNAYFALVGAHATVACQTCHANNVYAGTPTDCVGCHLADYTKTQNPNHAAAGFPTTCDVCHRPTDTQWQTGTGSFNHTAFFPLVGVHATVACAACHANNRYAGTPTDCVGCHQADYNRTQNPNHAAAGFPTTCDLCHRPTDPQWQNGSTSFDHNTVYPLVGVHATLACQTCHANNVYAGTPTACVGCHQTDYNKTQNPNHAAAGFPTTCEICHRPTDAQWQGARFDHNSVYPLVGVHATVACQTCHANNVYAGTPTACIGCHQADYNGTNNPNHAAAGFSTSCQACHRPADTQWQNASFDHNSVFPLVGVHATVACTTCHVNNVYAGTPTDCAGCHQADYNKTQSPNHAAAGFPTTCQVCHQPTDPTWQSATFNHNSFYPLVGVHATVACQTCHANNVYAGTPTNCIGCHQTNFNQAQNPNHVAGGFSTACQTCHPATDPTWQSASAFNHGTFFALVGQHATAACTACHVNNVYAGTPTDCVGCHLADYNGAQNPNHIAAGFPTTCSTCHQPADASWTQGVFNHTYFPLTGSHNVACARCHTTTNNFAVFSCTVCHSQSETNSDHHGVNGYVYDSVACYSCHPNGRSG